MYFNIFCKELSKLDEYQTYNEQYYGANYNEKIETQLAKVKNFAPNQMYPKDVIDLLERNIPRGLSSARFNGVYRAITTVEQLRDFILKGLVETGAITQDDAAQYVLDEQSGALQGAVDARNEAVNNAERIAEGKAPIYSAESDTMYGKFAKYVSNNKAKCSRYGYSNAPLGLFVEKR